MSRPFLIYFVINTFTTTVFSLFYTNFLRDERLNALLRRIEYLEENVEMLQQIIETIEEDIHDKNLVIESNMALNSKLEDFLNYNYDIN
jgi:vacuolar-type H+-ATPase subunit I/STV1